MPSIDRSQVSRELAKALAYAQCGKQREAEQWARRLVETLQCANILRSEFDSDWRHAEAAARTEPHA